LKIKDSANQLLSAFDSALTLNGKASRSEPLFAGVDLGTAYTVTAVVDALGNPVAGALTRSQASIRDGLVLDYVGAIKLLREQVKILREAGFRITTAAAAYPPGTTGRNAQAFGNVLQAAGLEVSGLIDEPTAASLVLDIKDGAVVDVGGGTTGISVIRHGEVVYTADEATGGVHLDLVIAGHYKISTEEAESIKTDPHRQSAIFPLVRPVFQKMASIVSHHLRQYPATPVYLVGGTSCFPGIEEVIADETGLSVERPLHPLWVTPLGIALSCLRTARAETGQRKEPP
jgi:ethanolamine utilization protein EutJ